MTAQPDQETTRRTEALPRKGPRMEGETQGKAEGEDGRRPKRDCMTSRHLGRPGRGAPDEFVGAGEAPPRVPGAAARPILAASLWASLPRWVLEQSTPLASFFRSLVTQKPKQEAPATGQAFPMPLPYPSVYRRSARRRTSRLRTSERHAVNLVVAVLSWLSLHCPGRARLWGSRSLASSVGQSAVWRGLSEFWFASLWWALPRWGGWRRRWRQSNSSSAGWRRLPGDWAESAATIWVPRTTCTTMRLRPRGLALPCALLPQGGP